MAKVIMLQTLIACVFVKYREQQLNYLSVMYAYIRITALERSVIWFVRLRNINLFFPYALCMIAYHYIKAIKDRLNISLSKSTPQVSLSLYS